MAAALPVLVGTAATSGAAATAGLFGTAGAFSAMSTLGTLSTIGSVVSPLLSARAQAQESKFMAAQAQMQAKQIEAQTLQNSNEIKRRLLSDLASANAGYSARGVSVSSGTPQQAATEAARVANRNIDIAQTGGRANQAQTELQASQYQSAAKTQMQTGLFKSLSTLGRVS